MKVTHSWLKEYVGEALPEPKKLKDLLIFGAFEVEDVVSLSGETVFDIDVLPNRSSDCFSHLGIARDISVLIDTPLKLDPFLTPQTELVLKPTDDISVTMADETACRRFGAVLMENVTIAPSPDWLRTRLLALGQRPINNVIDATNYVMLALGQPIHAYDADKFSKTDGHWQFGVRFARTDEKITTLTNEEYVCNDRVPLIVDQSNDTPASLAGIKGGQYAAVYETTKTIIIEAANFDPLITRRAARYLKLHTEASRRFENELPVDLIPYALHEVTKLIKALAGATDAGSVDHQKTKQSENRPATTVSLNKINSLLGITLDQETVTDIFNRLGITVTTDQDQTFRLKNPWWRTDLNIAEDYIEEIARVHGYKHIVSVSPKPKPASKINVHHYYSEQVSNILIKLGGSEVITSSFVEKAEIQLANALASDKSYLRPTLQQNIKTVLTANAPHAAELGTTDTRVFEIGTVFTRDDKTIDEHLSLCVGVQVKPGGYTKADDQTLQSLLTALDEALKVKINWQIENGVAETNFSKLTKQLPTPTKYTPVTKQPPIQYHPFSVYPAISRDIALWVKDNSPAEAVAEVINAKAGELRVRTTLIDTYKKDDRQSYAFRVVFQSNERTLTDQEVNQVMDIIYQALTKAGWDIR